MSVTRKNIDVGQVLNDGEWGGYQMFIVGLIALAVVLDGFDNLVLGIAIPAIAKSWNVQPSSFALVGALGLVALSFGALLAGWLGDKFGRRPLLIFNVVLFGVMTAAIAFVADVNQLIIVRMLGGVGLGGALPAATSLLAEFTPMRKRSLAISLGIVCVPIGGMFAGGLASYILPSYGWQMLFVIGGVVAVIVSIGLFFALPESPRFLARRPNEFGKLAQILNRITNSNEFDGTENFADMQEEMKSEGLTALFRQQYIWETIPYCLAFFANLFGFYMFTLWLPSLLAKTGMSPADSSQGAAFLNLGGVVGALAVGFLMTRFGSRRLMGIFAVGGVVSPLLLAITLNFGADKILVFIGIAFAGMFINGIGPSLFALGSHIYPTQIRATGVGAGLATGRVGGILSSFAGAAILSWQNSVNAYFGIVAVLMAICFVALLVVQKHIPKV